MITLLLNWEENNKQDQNYWYKDCKKRVRC